MPPYKSGMEERVKENMLDKFKDIICQYVEVKREDISEESRFVEDLGFNSYDFMSMVGELEDTYDIEVEEREIVDIRTVGEAVTYIQKLQNEN